MTATETTDATVTPDLTWPGQSRGLTERESQVLTLLAEGLTNREIAEALYLSPETIKSYLALIYSKLEVRNRVEANLCFLRLGEPA